MKRQKENCFRKTICRLLRLRLLSSALKENQIFYINGAQTLPVPLSPDEEKELLDALPQHPENRQILIEKNLRLVVFIAKKFESTGVGIEDLISIGSVGLIKAINTFKTDKNIKLATYASRCIENEILMNIRTEKKTSRNVYLYDSIGSDKEGNEINLIDVIE